MPEIVKKRCAIYTRKSVEEGLEQEFNSLDAQREAGEAFILSQKATGSVCRSITTMEDIPAVTPIGPRYKGFWMTARRGKSI